ncbi:MAG: major capsid protein [Spirochaetota bacterium]
MAAPDLFLRIMAAAYDEMRVRRQSNQPRFLMNFFGKTPQERTISNTDVIDIDVQRSNRKVAADVVRGGGQSNRNLPTRFTAEEYKVPLYSEEAPITAHQLYKRGIGQNPYDVSGDQRTALVRLVNEAQLKMTDKIELEMERMASEALLSGTITLRNSESLDFKKKGGHSLTPSTKWDAADPDILGDIEDHCQTIHQAGQLKPNTAIFGQIAWDLFWRDSDVQAALDKRFIEPGRISPAEVADGAVYQGRMWFGSYALDMYTYPQWYDNSSGTAVDYVTTDSVIIFNRMARLDKAFGAIELLPQSVSRYSEMGLPSLPAFVPGEMVPFAYEAPPSALMVGVQSAPVLIPVAIDTIGTIDNVD